MEKFILILRRLKRTHFQSPLIWPHAFIIALFFSITSLYSRTSLAYSQTVSKKTEPSESMKLIYPKKNGVNFSGRLSANHIESAIDHEDGTKVVMTEYQMNLNIDFNRVGILGITMIYDSYQNQPLKSGLLDTQLKFSSQSIPLSKSRHWESTFVGSGIMALPTNQQYKELTTFNGGLGASGGLKLTSKEFIIEQTYSFDLEVYKYFYEFDTNADGDSNLSIAAPQILGVDFTYGWFSVFGNYVHIHKFDYNGNVDADFRHNEGIGLSPSKFLKIQVGHSNSGNIFRPNGYTSNIKFFDEDSSIYFAKVALVF